jgi:hypothetical protein
MSRSRRSSGRKKVKKGSPIKSAIYIILLIGAVSYLGWYFLTEFTFRSEYNELVLDLDESFQANDKKNIEALSLKFEKSYAVNKAKPERERIINSQLIKCYRFISSDPGLSLKEQIAYLVKMNELNPSALSASDKKVLELR